jgi:hypothetical protein
MSESLPARYRITYLDIVDGREKSADLTGCPEWPVEECCRGKWTRGPGGPMSLDVLIRVREGVYLLRGRRYGPEPGVVYLRLWPEWSASLFARMGLLPPPDLEDWNEPAPVPPLGAPSAEPSGDTTADTAAGWQAQEPQAPSPDTPPAGTTVEKQAPETTANLDPVMELRKRRAPNRARLVEYMRDRASAPIEDIARYVHDNEKTSDDAIRANIKRTNEDLMELEVPIQFRVASGYVFKDVSSE